MYKYAYKMQKYTIIEYEQREENISDKKI